ncbi:MAG: hypothetical protein EOM10_11520 [Opitutae bacterium]|nr:hypothetical protein [Opitutae bacterium]
MTANTARAIRAADSITIVGFESRPGAQDWMWAIHGTVEGRMFQAVDGSSLTMLYRSVASAESAVRRHNKTVPIRVRYHAYTAA